MGVFSQELINSLLPEPTNPVRATIIRIEATSVDVWLFYISHVHVTLGMAAKHQQRTSNPKLLRTLYLSSIDTKYHTVTYRVINHTRLLVATTVLYLRLKHDGVHYI